MVVKYVRDAFHKFFQYQASGGILLVITAIVAIIIANSPWGEIYNHILHMPFIVQMGPLSIDKDFVHFINDGLMAIFFLLVSLEIKREIVEGHLSSRDQQIVPVIGALAGVIIPSLIYSYFNWNVAVDGESTIKGWAIPAATDIAFALGVLSLFGRKVPVSLKVFLTALAIIDDLIAIIIIALFYTSDLSYLSLLLGFASVAILVMFNLSGVTTKAPYVIVGIFLWICVLKSGIHATLAGVMIGLTIPIKLRDADGGVPLKKMEKGLEPWVSYLILPLFAFANAGVSLKGISFGDVITNPITLGAMVGLFLGKQLGIFATIRLLVKYKMAKMPEQASWTQIYGVSILAGIGFTMSIFIGNLSFIGNETLLNSARIGILIGSFLSAIIGYIILKLSCKEEY